MRKERARVPEWKLDPQTVRLIEWTLAGEPESRPLPEGAAEILATRRRADLFEAWEIVRAFGASAAEPLRQTYGFPEELTHQPDGLVTAVQAPRFADGIAEMLLEEPTVVGHDARGFAITDDKHKHWTAMEWPTHEDLRRSLYRRAKNILWRRMRREDRETAIILHETLEAAPRLARKLFLDDVEQCLAPIRRRMPELARHFRILSAAADPETAEVDLALVAQRYGVPAERIESFLAATILRKWKPELDKLWLELSLYVRRRQVRCVRPVRPDPELPGQFQIDED